MRYLILIILIFLLLVCLYSLESRISALETLVDSHQQWIEWAFGGVHGIPEEMPPKPDMDTGMGSSSFRYWQERLEGYNEKGVTLFPMPQRMKPIKRR